ncbi:MAG: hypothetical protein Devi2KO_35080 [Devosia indica]|uniref:Uncharacterized protein n=1 Tax=Devosia salina TaxID=2860336 RepID=A0ABX8WE01_9HYPH|nr:hypothetical protein [Devosia salina]QYO75662.1 hypothetical protein K1X15_13590 [Devosia salina]
MRIATKFATAALVLSLSGPVLAQSLNEFASPGALASFCADRALGSSTPAALTLADGRDIRGEVHCDAAAKAGDRPVAELVEEAGERPELPEQASDTARNAVASAGEMGAVMSEQNKPDHAGPPEGAGSSDAAGGASAASSGRR